MISFSNRNSILSNINRSTNLSGSRRYMNQVKQVKGVNRMKLLNFTVFILASLYKPVAVS